jgi:hypothetical protein
MNLYKNIILNISIMRNYYFKIFIHSLKSIEFNISSFIYEINDFNKINDIDDIQLTKILVNNDFDNYSIFIKLFENGDKINDYIINSYKTLFHKFNLKYDNEYNIIDDDGASVYTF